MVTITRLDGVKNSIIMILIREEEISLADARSTAAPRSGASTAGSASPPGNFAIEEPTAYELKVSRHSLVNLAAFCITVSPN